MAETVIGDDGKEYPVIQMPAVVAISSPSSMRGDLPPDAASRIEQAMAAAVQNAIAEFGHDADRIREEMLKARESVKLAMRIEMRDAASQEGSQST